MTISQTKIIRIPRHIITPLRLFFNDSRSTGLLLVICTIFSLAVSNSNIGPWYIGLFTRKLSSGADDLLPGSLTGWINNFGMSFFFLLAATEIKRELINGELGTYRKAILPIGAAFGGMVAPALIFMVCCFHTNYAHGWGIPAATDIAFSLAAASLLGKRFPVELKILLMALAIIDDLGAIVIVAVFYGGQIHWLFLGISALISVFLFLCTYFKIKFGAIQVLLGFCLWFALLQSGIEASISGVIFAFLLPAQASEYLESGIHRFVHYGILPLFAIANTALRFPANPLDSLYSAPALGIMAGLVIGKPLGIFLASRILVALKIAQLPGRITWRQFIGMGNLAGIGFTMSIFTTMLAFPDPEARNISKFAILMAALISLLFGLFYYRALPGAKSNKALGGSGTVIPHNTLHLTRG